jgi:hypothetical protein
MLLDRTSGKNLGIAFFESEEDMRKGDEAECDDSAPGHERTTDIRRDVRGGDRREKLSRSRLGLCGA